MGSFTNRLIHETSPYLIQHAHNPVEWFPWGPEAFERAKFENKPILVSIGYSACHWCHVMERESFEDENVAKRMNELLISIKVDREERPDIDGIYMSAVQQMHGHGGWPLNVFLLPDGRPFYGGTYFPPSDFRGMPSWLNVIEAIADAYHNQRETVENNASVLTNALVVPASDDLSDFTLDSTVAQNAFSIIASNFDKEHGGFGNAPKFPQTMPQEFLLRYYYRTGSNSARDMVEITMKKMASGGIYDHLGGGFSRYATDNQWVVPHFEKMLYDNALIASLYLQLYTITEDSTYRNLVHSIINYVGRDLKHPDGGFYSSQDADSEGEEGKYYVWTLEEIESLLGETSKIYRHIYGISSKGNFEGKNILHIAKSLSVSSEELNVEIGKLSKILDSANTKLLDERNKRIRPTVDDKILTSWNALMLRVLAEAGFTFDCNEYIRMAEDNAKFLLTNLYKNNRLLRTWKDQKAHLLGYLEDYAFLANALISLHVATFSHEWLVKARLLIDQMIELFWDHEANKFYDVGYDHEELITRPYQVFDNAIPSGASAATEALIRMHKLTGVKDYFMKAETSLCGVAPLLSRYPLGFGNWLKVLELYLAETVELVVVGDPQIKLTKELVSPLRDNFFPFITFLGINPKSNMIFDTPLSIERINVETPTAYLCNNFICELPTGDPLELRFMLGL
ncbi:MAG: thioredoxin domain-containing protein [Chloroflexi bacterium]|nr:thioredoxin domain-containing protein [Chloroflexota bacterium]